MRRALLAVLVLLLVAVPRAQQPATVQQYLDAWQEASGVPGVAVGIVLKDGTVISAASGESDREAHTKMKPTDLMLAGSTGKTFFAAVAIQLIEQGKLDLDAKISKYLGARPWFSRLPNAADVTVRQLMTHTSGIIRYEFDDKFTKDLRANPGKTWTPEEEVAYLFDTKAPFAAGQGWDYSDTNYIVLGMIVEDILKANYYAEIDKRFIKPLNLKGVAPSTSRKIPGLVQGYAAANDPLGLGGPVIKDGEFVVNPQFEWAGGGFATSAVDLARWGHELYAPNGKALSAKARALMIDSAVPARLQVRPRRDHPPARQHAEPHDDLSHVGPQRFLSRLSVRAYLRRRHGHDAGDSDQLVGSAQAGECVTSSRPLRSREDLLKRKIAQFQDRKIQNLAILR
jgi:D-alanyl-D-alanine carboxypeptidase